MDIFEDMIRRFMIKVVEDEVIGRGLVLWNLYLVGDEEYILL